MSETKRVAFTTITSNISPSTFAAASNAIPAYRTVGGSNALTANKSSMSFSGNGEIEEDGEHGKKHEKTFRLELTLFQTDSSKYPEFNYSRLVHLQKKKIKKLKARPNELPAELIGDGVDNDVTRIARELEKKYGSAYGNQRSRGRKNDAGDKGMGYDESDSFIDNTEAFDEVIPEEVETLEGGFYINCGALEFKKLQTELIKTKTDEIIKMPNRPKKRESSTSSSEDSSTTEEDDEADDDDEDEDDDEEDEEEADDSSTANNRQKSGNSSSSTTTSVTVKKAQAVEMENKPESGQQIVVSSSSNSPKPVGEELGSDSDRDRVEVKTTTVKDMLKAKRDNYLKSQVHEGKSNANGQVKSTGSRSTDDEDEESTTSSDESEDSNESGVSAERAQTEQKPATIPNTPAIIVEEANEKLEVKLPAGLSPQLIELLRIFKETALSKGMLGKKFQFDERAAQQFLKIDNLLITLDKTTRSVVLAHLEIYLQLSKYYFLRKAKQLRIKEEKQNSKHALAKLRKAVIETMPIAISEYEIETRKYLDLTTANMNVDQASIVAKKFPWNNNLRYLLFEVYEVRIGSFAVLRTRKQSFEEFMEEYLRSKVLDVWPTGWMRFEELLLEIEKIKTDKTAFKLYKEQCSTKKHAGTASMAVRNQNVCATEMLATTTQMTAATITTAGVGAVTMSTNKRKHADGSTKVRKSKSQKKDIYIGPIEQSNTNKKSPITIAADAPTYKQSNDFSANLQKQQQQQQQQLQHIQGMHMQTTAADFSTFQQQYQQQQQQQQLQLQSHSMPQVNSGTKSAHIIDLDNYKNTNDILQTSKQLINAVQQQHQQQQQQQQMLTSSNYKQQMPVAVQDSSSESDGVEIVGVYRNKMPNAKNVNSHKQKQNANKHIDPLAMKMYANATTNNAAINLNINNNYNRKHTLQNDMDVMLKDFKKFDQVKLPTTATSTLGAITTVPMDKSVIQSRGPQNQ